MTAAPSNPTQGRWFRVLGAILVQLSLGAVYAWSVFVNPFINQMGWSRTETALPFTVTIATLFVGTFIGGRLQDRIGPRPVVIAGGIIYSIGVMLGSLVNSPDQLWLLVVTYGLIAGFGGGMGYIVPVAMLVKWFPDKRGLITGLAVGGYGGGALITAPVARNLIDPNDVAQVFLLLGVAYLIATVIGGSLFRNPPAGYHVPGFDPSKLRAQGTTRDYSLQEALRTPQWYRLTAILTLNVTAGIALISQADPAAQSITGVTPETASGLVGILALFNGGGRIFWGWVSDTTGRMRAFLLIFAVQVVCFLLLPFAAPVALFFVLAALVYLCYGGGFGTMPATAGDFFGTRNVGAIYGAIIVGWSIGGIIGPLAIAALVEASGGFTLPFLLTAALVLVSALVPLTTRRPEEDEPVQATPQQA